MNRRYEGRHVVVTGGLGALGRAVVARLLEEGAVCHVPDLQAPPTVPPWVQADRVFMYGPLDLTAEAQVESLYGSLPSLWASIHVAGGFHMAPLAEIRADTFRAQLEMNLVSAFLCLREASKRMTGSGGRMVNVISRPALHPCGGMIGYSTAKAALASLTQCAAEELRGAGIYVNAIAPSIIDTEANRQAMPNAHHAAWPKPDELAATIAFLASPENTVTSGALVPVFGRA
jgi:NAD(P)-dependent dehydrogenase (short-subunit alcohol dehydrogenase family)